MERLSGGETILVALAALFLRRPDIMLLDEPTNNLDLDARRRLYDAVASWSGVMVIVSHDRELLALVDQIADLSGGEVRIYGGDLAAYTELLAAEQAAAERAVTAASADVRREHRDLVDAQVKQARRDRQGRKVAASGGLPRIVAYARKRPPRRPRAGPASCTPSASRRPVTGWKGRSRRSATTRRSGSTCRARPSRPGAPS